jgi:hypothetical protein
MLEYMKKHELFSRGKLTAVEGNRMRTAMWKELSNELNSDPFGPEKDAAKWQKVSTHKLLSNEPNIGCLLRRLTSEIFHSSAGLDRLEMRRQKEGGQSPCLRRRDWWRPRTLDERTAYSDRRGSLGLRGNRGCGGQRVRTREQGGRFRGQLMCPNPPRGWRPFLCPPSRWGQKFSGRNTGRMQPSVHPRRNIWRIRKRGSVGSIQPIRIHI